MIQVCTVCSEEYVCVEYRPAPVDPDEPRFCSSLCEDAYWDAAGYPAPVFGP
jgi:hypothetical protein